MKGASYDPKEIHYGRGAVFLADVEVSADEMTLLSRAFQKSAAVALTIREAYSIVRGNLTAEERAAAASVKLGFFHRPEKSGIRQRFDDSADWDMRPFAEPEQLAAAQQARYTAFADFERLFGQHENMLMAHADRVWSRGRNVVCAGKYATPIRDLNRLTDAIDLVVRRQQSEASCEAQ